MLRDVPHFKCILKCGAGGLILCVVLLTWIYPAYCSRVSQIKESKVRDFVEDRYGIADSSVNRLTSESDVSREMSGDVGASSATHASGSDEAQYAGRQASPDDVSVRKVQLATGKMR